MMITVVVKKVGDFIKEELEKNLPGIKVNLKQQPYKQKLDLEKKFEYEFSLSAWSPDYPDPMTYIDMFVTGSSFNEMDYSNPKYDELVAKSKGELLKDDKARWNALAEAEKILIGQDACHFSYVPTKYRILRETIRKRYCKSYVWWGLQL
ncbi:ABC transporter substrate-binding protein [Bacillus paranthracis]